MEVANLAFVVWEERKCGMNGIDYGTLFGNSSLFGQTDKVNNNSLMKGKLTGVSKKKEEKADAQDSVEISGKSREIPVAGYQKPKMKVTQNKQSQEATNIQESELSDAAKELLAELREKYTNMEFTVTSWNSDEEEEYYASKCEKDFSVLIDPQLLEQMAADEDVRVKYEEVLDGASGKSETLKEELGEDAEKIESFTIAIDGNGKVSYIVQLVEDFAKKNKIDKKEQQEEIKEKRKIRAESMEELLAAIKEKLEKE